MKPEVLIQWANQTADEFIKVIVFHQPETTPDTLEVMRHSFKQGFLKCASLLKLHNQLKGD